MLSAVRALIATMLIVLAAPAAACAQAPAPAADAVVVQGGDPAPDPTVGPGQVITDPATETEPPPATTDAPAATDGVAQELPADQTKRGEVHVLDTATASSPAPAAAAPPPAQAPEAAAAAAPARAVSATSRKTLPFTGADAGVLALVGLGLLAAGSGLLAVLRQPVQ
jgi:hypothetical protein